MPNPRHKLFRSRLLVISGTSMTANSIFVHIIPAPSTTALVHVCNSTAHMLGDFDNISQNLSTTYSRHLGHTHNHRHQLQGTPPQIWPSHISESVLPCTRIMFLHLLSIEALSPCLHYFPNPDNHCFSSLRRVPKHTTTTGLASRDPHKLLNEGIRFGWISIRENLIPRLQAAATNTRTPCIDFASSAQQAKRDLSSARNIQSPMDRNTRSDAKHRCKWIISD